VQTYHFEIDGNGYSIGYVLSDNSDIIVNEATLEDTSADGRYEISMQGGNDVFQNTNTGNLQGQIHMGDGNDSDTFILNGNPANIGADALINGGLGGNDILALSGANDGSIYVLNASDLAHIIEFEDLEQRAGTWYTSANLAFDSLTVSGGQLTLDGTSNGIDLISVDHGTLVVDGVLTTTNDLVINSSATTLGRLNGTGLIHGNVVNRGTASPATHGTIGTLTVDGDYTATAGSVLQIDIDAANGRGDQLIVNRDLIINTDAQLQINALSAPVEDRTFVMILADVSGTTTGRFTLATPLGDSYNMIYDDDTQNVLLTVGEKLVPVVVSPDTEEETLVARRILNSNKVTNQLITEPGGANVVAALGAGLVPEHELALLTPEFYVAVYQANANAGTSASRYLIERIDDREHCGTLEGAGQENCRQLADGMNIWGALDADLGNFDDREHMDVNYQFYRAMFGLDQRIGSSTLGLAAGYGYGTGSEDHFGNYNTHYAHADAYVSQQVSYFNLDAALGYTFGWGEGNRTIKEIVGNKLNQTYTGSIQSHSATAMARVTQEYQAENGFEFQPQVGAEYHLASFADMKESAGGSYSALGLNIENWSHDQLTGFAGAEVRKAFESGNTIFIPEVRGMARYMLLGADISVPAAFTLDPANTAFSKSAKLPQATFTLGGGVNVEARDALTFFADYDFTFGDESHQHDLRGGLRVKF
jgi:outer membrane autotransporter protein